MRSTNNKRSNVIFLVVAILVVVNVIGFLIYSRSKGGDESEKLAASDLVGKSTDQGPSTEELAAEKEVDALRKEALNHFVNDEYEEAVVLLGKALKISSDKKDLPDLLNMAKQRLEMQKAGTAVVAGNSANVEVSGSGEVNPVAANPVAANPGAVGQSPAPVNNNASRPVKRQSKAEKRRLAKAAAKAARQQAARVEVEPAVPAVEIPKMGTLVVVSSPKMAFTIDGVMQGVTPKEIQVAPGKSHSIAFKYRSQTLKRRSVTVQPGKMAYIDENLGDAVAELDANTKQEATAKAEQEAAAKRAQAASLAAKPAPKSVATTNTGAKGELHVISPNMFGDIYVNGKNYGTPPRVIKNLPAGPVRVEIRVQDKARRAKMVKISGGKRTKLRFR